MLYHGGRKAPRQAAPVHRALVSEENPIMFPTNTTVPNAVDIVIDNSTPIRTAHGDKSTSRVTTANFSKEHELPVTDRNSSFAPVSFMILRLE